MAQRAVGPPSQRPARNPVWAMALQGLPMYQRDTHCPARLSPCWPRAAQGPAHPSDGKNAAGP